jgi:hypothetical protein
MYRMIGLAALGVLAASPAFAQQAAQCAERPVVLKTLAEKFQEKPVGMGLASNGGIIEVLSQGDAGKTWTILITMPNGMTCLVAAGENWEPITVAQLGPNT